MAADWNRLAAASQRSGKACHGSPRLAEKFLHTPGRAGCPGQREMQTNPFGWMLLCHMGMVLKLFLFSPSSKKRPIGQARPGEREITFCFRKEEA